MSGIAPLFWLCDQHRRAFRRRRGKIADHAALPGGRRIGNTIVGVIEAAVTYGLGLAFGAI